jgi:hypothetical protein
VLSKTVPEDRISTADFARYRRNFDIMLGKLEKESAIELTKMDTSEIDSVMLYLVEHFDKAAAFFKHASKRKAVRTVVAAAAQDHGIAQIIPARLQRVQHGRSRGRNQPRLGDIAGVNGIKIIGFGCLGGQNNLHNASYGALRMDY